MSSVDYDYLPLLRDCLQEFYGKNRSGIHVSDLVYCPRRSAFRKLDKNPPKLTDRELGNFSSGRGVHAAIESLVSKRKERFETEKEVWLDGLDGTHALVVAHVDVYDKERKIPSEWKTYRCQMGKVDTYQPPEMNMQQLKWYMAMTNSNVGVLMAQFLNDFRKFPFKQWIVRLTDTELASERILLISLAQKLKKAVDKQDPSIAPHVAFDKERQFLCEQCPYKEPCFKSIKEKEGKDAWAIETERFENEKSRKQLVARMTVQ